MPGARHSWLRNFKHHKRALFSETLCVKTQDTTQRTPPPHTHTHTHTHTWGCILKVQWPLGCGKKRLISQRCGILALLVGGQVKGPLWTVENLPKKPNSSQQFPRGSRRRDSCRPGAQRGDIQVLFHHDLLFNTSFPGSGPE